MTKYKGGVIRDDGYRMQWDRAQHKYRMEHRMIWERHFGPIPEGYEMHHIDHNRLNNDISNLMLVTPLEHKRIEQGCELRNGIWFKPCLACGKMKELNEENFYFQKSTGFPLYPRCKPCHCEYTIVQRKKRQPPKRIFSGRRSDLIREREDTMAPDAAIGVPSLRQRKRI